MKNKEPVTAPPKAISLHVLELAQLQLSDKDTEELSQMLVRTQGGIEKLRELQLGDTEPPVCFHPQ